MSATPTSLEPGAGQRRAGLLIVLVLGSLTALGPLTIDLYLPALPQVGRSLTASPVGVQLTVTAFLVGVAAGQLVVGPLSDTLGRRRPLLVGMGAYVLVSAACAAAPNAGTLVGLRLVQGLVAAVGVVIARAVVRDLFAGVAAARVFSSLMLVSGAAPLPTLGLMDGLPGVARMSVSDYDVSGAYLVDRGLPDQDEAVRDQVRSVADG
jgi:DHA1 family bicyclomycin/chloramphenicol resistance-like MFS transporter